MNFVHEDLKVLVERALELQEIFTNVHIELSEADFQKQKEFYPYTFLTGLLGGVKFFVSHERDFVSQVHYGGA